MAYHKRLVPVLCDLRTLADMAHRLAKCEANENWSHARLVTFFLPGIL